MESDAFLGLEKVFMMLQFDNTGLQNFRIEVDMIHKCYLETFNRLKHFPLFQIWGKTSGTLPRNSSTNIFYD